MNTRDHHVFPVPRLNALLSRVDMNQGEKLESIKAMVSVWGQARQERRAEQTNEMIRGLQFQVQSLLHRPIGARRKYNNQRWKRNGPRNRFVPVASSSKKGSTRCLGLCKAFASSSPSVGKNKASMGGQSSHGSEVGQQNPRRESFSGMELNTSTNSRGLN